MVQDGSYSIASVRDDPEAALVDNLTLFHAQPLFTQIPSVEREFTPRVISALARDPSASAFLAFLESVVLLERCFVDHFTLQASSSCLEVQSLFSEILKPITIEPDRRDWIYRHLLTLQSNRNSISLIDQERRLALKSHAPALKKKVNTFVEKYYDPSDRFKREAIAKGAYDPLNVIRSQFYVELAKLCGVPYAPHPWREKLLSFGLTKRAPIAIDVSQHVFAALEEFRKELSQSISIVETTTAPPIAAAILVRAKTPKYVAEAAMDMRMSQRARAFRKWCAEFTEAIAQNDVAKQQKKWLAVKEAALKWKTDLEDEVRYRRRSLKIGVGAFSMKADVDLGSFKDPMLLVESRFRPLLLLNDVFRI